MQVPVTPSAVQEGGGAPELLLELLELLLVEELLELELLELDPVGVQHCSLEEPGQWPGVETYPFIAAQTEVSRHVPATPFTEQVGGAEPLELPPVDPVVGPSGVDGSTTTTSTRARSAWPCSPPKR